MYTEHLLCDPPWTRTVSTTTTTSPPFTEGSIWARGLGLLFIPLNYPMRQRPSIPISQMSQLRLWAIKQLAQGPDASKWQRQDTNPDMSHKLSTRGPTASCRKGRWEPWKVPNRKLESYHLFREQPLVVSLEEGWGPTLDVAAI